MPTPPASGPTSPAAVIRGWSPREAAQRAIIYRRTRERPRERGLRVLGLVGTIIVHLAVLFGMVLGPAYELQPPEDLPETALQVRLIDKPEPPPPPPPRGTPPRQRGPLHRASVAGNRPAVAANTNRTRTATPSHTPVLSAAPTPASITPAPTAAPPRPASLPRPKPAPPLAPIPPSGAPSRITLATPPAIQLVPPAFQPKPVRKPQAEGNRPLPPPPSLALPELPAQAPPTVAPPSIALDQPAPGSDTPPASQPLARPLPLPPSPPVMEPVPLPATQAPAIQLDSVATAPSISVPRERPRVKAAAITPDQPQVAEIPATDQAAPIQPAAPAAPTLDAQAITPPRIQPTLARPQVAETPVAEVAPQSTAPAEAASIQPPAPSANTATAAAPADTAAAQAPASPSPGTDVSTAPEASPQGSDTATPGQPQGTDNPPTRQASTAAAPTHGNGTQGLGKAGTPQPGAANGAAHGAVSGKNDKALGSYIELRPRGDTSIMSHGAPNIGYQPTRFAGDWTPEGESSIDTALRHAVEKTTVKHVFHLPRGVRVGCHVSPLFPLALFGCGAADPPPKPASQAIHERLDLAPVKPLAAPVPAATTAKPAPVPIQLDNAALCAAARLSGGPPPPDCAAPATAAPAPRLPAPTSSSWVPASDQFH